ncbi:MAG: TolC family protein [Bacteroidales bacterium]|nr:TolC family protein [Bacteroidales bacterium]
MTGIINKLKFLFFPLFIFGLFAQAQEDELSLSLALQKALENNYGIIISRSETEIVIVNNEWGTAGRYPFIDFSGGSYNSYDLNNIDNFTSNRLSAGLGLRWTIFEGFKVKITKDKLDQLEILAKGRTAVVVESTIQDVIMAYYLVLLEQEELIVLENVMKLSKDRYDYEQSRYELGSTASYNVLQAKNVYLNDKTLFMNKGMVLRNSIRNFNFLIGEDASRTWDFIEEFSPGTGSYKLSDLLDKMMASNQTLQNQYANLLLEQNEIKLKKSDLYPSFDLSAGVTENWAHINRLESDPTNANNLNTYGNLLLSYPIYMGGIRKRAVDVARINEEIANVQVDEMKHRLTNQLMNIYDFHEVRLAILDVTEEGLEAAELNMQIANEKFRTGAINSFNYRDIQLIYLNSSIIRLNAIYDVIDSRTNLTRLIGGFITEN